MSRAFVNEDKHEEMPIVAPRPHLPEGVPNYVTENGMEQLLTEKQQLIDELKEVKNGESLDKVTRQKVINLKLQMLEERIVTARIVNQELQDYETVKFGSTVLLQIGESDKTRKFTIVGVDEADLKSNKIAFTSPLASVLIQKKVGDRVELPNTGNSFKILAVE